VLNGLNGSEIDAKIHFALFDFVRFLFGIANFLPWKTRLSNCLCHMNWMNFLGVIFGKEFINVSRTIVLEDFHCERETDAMRAHVKDFGKSFRDKDVGAALSGISWDAKQFIQHFVVNVVALPSISRGSILLRRMLSRKSICRIFRFVTSS